MRKRLLCIAPDDVHTAALMTGPIHDWDTCCVDNLGDADRVLRADGYPVGLLLRVRSLLRSFDLDGFLRRHHDTQWIGVFRPKVSMVGRDGKVQTKTLPWIIVLPPWYYIAAVLVAIAFPIWRWRRNRKRWQAVLAMLGDDGELDDDVEWDEA